MTRRRTWVHFAPAGPDIAPAKPTHRRKRPKRRRTSATPVRALYVVTGRGCVKVGISDNVEARLRSHARQGLTKVVYILRADSHGSVREVEARWKRYVRGQPQLQVTRADFADGWTETLKLTDEVKGFIDRLVGKSPGDSD